MDAETYRLMYLDRLQRLLVAAWIAFYLLPIAGRFAGVVWALLAVPLSWLGCLSVSLLLTRRAGNRSASPIWTAIVALVFQCILVAAYFLVGAAMFGDTFASAPSSADH